MFMESLDLSERGDPSLTAFDGFTWKEEDGHKTRPYSRK
jgi:hypothetical protein